MEPTQEKSLIVVESSARKEEPPHLPATTLVQALAAAASDPRTDMDKMERLFKMHQAMLAQQAETAFNTAMARAQEKILPVANNATNDHTKSRYAKLAAINRAITPLYTAEGISISFDNADSPKPDHYRIIALVSHSGGHTRQYHIDLALDKVGLQGNANKTAVQATGSTNSYARRYLMCLIFNISTEDDNDGNKDAKEMGADRRESFAEQIAKLTDLKSADVLWATIASECTKARDVQAYDELQTAFVAKRRALKKAESSI